MSARRLIIWISTLLAAAMLFPLPAGAHAHLVRADLAPDAHLVVHAGTYRFWFDESLNPSLSKIIIRDAGGHQVNTDTGRLNPTNSLELDVTVPTLPNGQYTVFWTSDSQQDGHILHGFYLFTAGGPGAIAPSAAPAAIAAPDNPTLDATALAVALAHWLVLAASALWTGVLALEVLVLAPARHAGGDRVRLATAASAVGVVVARLGLLATLIASLLELGTYAYDAGGWSGLTSETVIGDILNSQYGTFWVVRMLVAFGTLLVLGSAAERAVDTVLSGRPRAQGLVAPARSAGVARPLGNITAYFAAACALAYLLALALSGHAAAVPELVVTSVLLDWLHLLAMAVWVGGMAAIAVLLVPALLAEHAEDGRQFDDRTAVLDLLDRYSPAAFVALATAGATGMFNAQVHLSSFQQLIDTAYGRFLLIKLALIAEIALLSASHVFFSRPRLRRLTDPVRLKEGYASLAIRLRIEPLIGMLILLCVALMGQVAPSVTLFAQQSQATAPGPAPTPSSTTAAGPISGVSASGSLTVGLQVASPAVGRTRFLVTVRENGKAITGDNGQVRIRLSMPDNPTLGSVFEETSAVRGGYSGAGDLVQEGPWAADVMVRTRSDPSEYRDVPFLFLVGSGARFISVPPIDHRYGPASVTLTQPSAAPDVLSVRLKPGLTVQYLLNMPEMPGMGSGDYAATEKGGGLYSSTVNFPMTGLTNVAIQVQQAGQWHLVRLLVYSVDDNGIAHLLTP
jgi:copper transport protein